MKDPALTPQISTNTTSRFIENIFQLQKTKIDEIKRRQCEFDYKFSQEDLKQSVKTIEFRRDSHEYWEHSLIIFKKITEEETPLLQLCDWERFNSPFTSQLMQIQNEIFLSESEIDYELSNLKLESTFSISNDSSFWLGLRAGKEIDEYTALIKVSKENNRIFVSLGTYVRSGIGNPATLIFKNFSRQQLVIGKNMSEETEITIYVIDNGEERIEVMARVGGNKDENMIKSDFFLPIIQRRNIMFFGNGRSCHIKNLLCEVNTKNKFLNGLLNNGNMTSFSMERKNCNCCVIW